MFRPYVTDPPLRKDVTFYTNSDYPMGVVWGTTAGTPVPVSSAELTLEFDIPPTTFDPDTGDPLPDPDPVREVLDPDLELGDFELGQVMFIVPNGLWATVTERSGNYDIVAMSTDGIRKQLRRGIFTVEQGVTT